MPDSSPEPGQRVGRYEVLEEIGRGGMGIVYRARDPGLGRDVALKRPIPEHVSDPDFRRRFLREARAIAAVAHPNIVSIYEVLEHEGSPWLAFALVPGESLRQVLKRRGALPVQEVLRYGQELAEALHAAHSHRVLHRDIKPDNVIVNDSGHALLTDFGLACFFAPPGDPSSAATLSDPLTEPSAAVGTPAYMSPEQALGREIDARSDIFSLGLVMYEMCTGVAAFHAPSRPAILDAVLHRQPEPIARFNYRVPADLEQIIRKAINKDSSERYQSAGEILADLRTLRRRIEFESYPREHPGTAPARSLGRRLRGSFTRHPLALTGAAIVVAALIVVAAVASWPLLRRGKPPAATPKERFRIAALLPQAPPGRADLSSWPDLIQMLFSSELTGISELRFVEPLSLNGLLRTSLGSTAPSRGPGLYRVLREAGIPFVIDGVIVPGAGGYGLHLSLVGSRDGAVAVSRSFVLSGQDQLSSAIGSFSQEILAYLQMQMSGFGRDRDILPWVSLKKHDLGAVRAFLQASQYAYRRGPGVQDALRRAIELEPGFVAPRVWLVGSLNESGKVEEARQHLEVLRKLEPAANAFEQTMIAWASARLRRDLPAQAKYLETALEYSPGNNILLLNLADVRADMEDWEGAQRALHEPLEARWIYPPLYSLWAWCSINLDRLDDAERVLEIGRSVAPADPEIYGLSEGIAIARGRPDLAETFRRLFSSHLPEEERAYNLALLAPAYRRLGEHCRKAQRPEAAATLFRMAIAGDPVDPAGHQGLARTLYGLGDLPGAERECLQALGIRPEHPECHLILGKIDETKSAGADAVRHYEQYLALAPGAEDAAEIRERLKELRK